MAKQFIFLSFFSTIMFSAHFAYADKSPGQVIDESWTQVCLDPEPGSELAIRCENVDGGNGAGPEAAAGNNAGTSSGLGNSTIYADRQHKKAIEDRQEELKKQGAAAGDILSGERLGFFVSGKMTEIDRKNTVLETGYNSDMQGFTVGMDYFFNEKFVAGLAVGYSDTDLGYKNNAGSTDFETINVLTYFNYRVTDNLSADGYIGWSGIDYDLQRNINYDLGPLCGCETVNSAAYANTDADKVLAGLNLSYAMNFGVFEFTPGLRMDYSGTFIEGYSETGGSGLAFDYDSQDIQSFKTDLGFDGTYAYSTSWGVILPRVKARYIHEFLHHRRTIHASFIEDATGYNLQFETDKPDRDYFVIGGGISTVLKHGIQLFVDYERIEGNRYMNSFTISGGIRVVI